MIRWSAVAVYGCRPDLAANQGAEKTCRIENGTGKVGIEIIKRNINPLNFL